MPQAVPEPRKEMPKAEIDEPTFKARYLSQFFDPSFGVATVSGDEGLAALFRRADEALYHAKKSGRDRVRLSYQRPEAPIESAVIL